MARSTRWSWPISSLAVVMTLFLAGLALPDLVEADETTKVGTYRIKEVYPHDPKAFTQGLVYADGVLYEGTGLNGQSSLRKVDLLTGQVLHWRLLPEEFFGEGIAVFGQRVIQLTWRSRVGFIYDRESFRLLDKFRYETEGWGLTHDGKRLIMSDGTSTLYFLDPNDFSLLSKVTVHDGNEPVNMLNELEYVNGEILANVWLTDRIARIDPKSGKVTGWIDLSGLLGEGVRQGRDDVLNGIAYDKAGDRLFVTGKRWPNLFEIQLLSAE